jgi:FkbH-like protein
MTSTATGGARDGTGNAAQLVTLHRAGELVSRYPEVRRLVAELPEDDLVTAGQLLSRLDPDEIRLAHPTVPTVAVWITGHGTLAPLVAPLTAEFARHGLVVRASVGDFDSYLFDLDDPGSELYATKPDIVLCVLDPMIIIDELPVPWQVADVERVVDEKRRLLGRLAARFQQASGGLLVFNTVPLLRQLTGQLLDHRSRARLGAVWREFNAGLLRLAEEHRSVVVLDLEPLVAEGVPAVDPRFSRYAKVHLSPRLLARYAREVGHLARHVAGQTKKVLALDLDGTLWGGVLGDDGPDGIDVAHSHRGEAFRAFQRVIRQFAAQGVLLAAISKNDPEPVARVLREHPHMTVRENDFVRVVANWRPKPDNLSELADDLNLGVDSFVFVDDSPYESGLIRHARPQIAVVPLDDEPARHIDALLRDGWFDTGELTTEDRSRTAKYRAELARKDFLDDFDSLADYLRELRITVLLSRAGDPDVPRLSQLSLRTNQFNLTTLRLQPPQVSYLIADPSALVLAVRASDRFGDQGLVGAVFAHRTGDALYIDNFLLSCRVFARGIEQTCLSAVLRHARATGAVEVFGGYRATAKNRKVKDFYPRYGFTTLTDDGATTTFVHDLADLPDVPVHINLTHDLAEAEYEHHR